MEVVLEQAETMNLLGLFLKLILEGNFQKAQLVAVARNTRGNVQIGASRMKITLCFEGERVVIRRDWELPARAKVAASLDTFLAIGLGGNPVIPFLQGKVKLGGNLFWLLKLMPLFKVN